MTLVEAMQMSNNPLVGKVIYNMGMHSPLMTTLDFVLGKELNKEFARTDGLNFPSMSTWHNIGESPTAESGKFERVRTNMYLSRHQVSVDKVLQENPNSIGDPIGTQVAMAIRAFSHDFNDKFINNDNISGNSKCFDGLRGRMNKRSDYGIPSELRKSMGAIDMRASTMTAAMAHQFMRALDELLMVISGGNGDYSKVCLFANDTVITAMSQAIRMMGAGAGFGTTTDAYDRHFETYRGAKIINPGLAYPYRSMNRIMPNSENADGITTTGGSASSLFAVRFDQEDGVIPWMRHSFEEAVIPIPRVVNDGLTDKVTIDLGFSLAQTNLLSLGQIYNFRVA